MRLFFLFSLFVMIIMGAGHRAVAQSMDNPYIVRDVTVDMVSESAVRAREKAFAQAQMKAFEMLRTRFLNEAEREGKPLPSPDRVAGMVQDFELVSEQTSRRRYIGTYVFRFKEGVVRNYFGREPLPEFQNATIAQTDPRIVLLPFFQQDQTLSLWARDKNPWLSAWRESSSQGIVIPKGDSSDIFDVREVQDVSKINTAGLKRLLARYDVRDVVVAVAKFDRASVQTPLHIDLYHYDGKIFTLAQTLQIPVGDARRLGDLLKTAVPKVEEALQTNWKSGSSPDTTQKTLTEDKSSETLSVDEQNTMPAQTYQAQDGQATLNVRFATMNDWLVTRRALNEIPAIRNLKITALRGNEAILTVSYSDWASLQSALAARGFTLIPLGDNVYNLGRGR